MKKLLAIAAIALMCTGCDSFERTTFKTLSASKAVIDQAQTDYESHALPHSACAYSLINNAKATQTAAVSAMVLYEEEKAAKADLASQTALVSSTIASLPPLIVKLKTLYTDPSSCGGSK